jgi:3',5'-cyclic AMP phosphodiesterase CpdA
MTATRIAHITDLHFGAENPSVVAALLTELNDDPPDLVAVSGDLTQGARISEFCAARSFLDQLRTPSLTVPGNHDISPYNLLERFSNPYARWRRFISPETSPLWRNDTVAVLGLNSARRLGLHWDWSRGRVTRKRLQALLMRLDSLPASLVKVVVVHHPLLPPGDAPETPLVGGAVNALRALEARKVRLVLAGHLHRGYSGFASIDRQGPMILQGATTTSVRLRGEPNAYNRVAVYPDGKLDLQVRVWDGRAWKSREKRCVERRAVSNSGYSEI